MVRVPRTSGNLSAMVKEPFDRPLLAADAAQDQVGEAGCQSAAMLPQADQRVRGQRGNLEEDEHVEGVACDRDAEQATQAQEEGRVVQMMVAFAYTRLIGAQAEGHDDSADRSHDHQDIGIEQVDAVLDAQRRRPAAKLVADDAFSLYLAQ